MNIFPLELKEKWPELKAKLRMPAIVLVALWALLLLNGLLGVFIHNNIWYVEVPVAAVMVATIIVFSMEAYKAPPLVRLFAGVGFFWVSILFALILLDYATR